MSWERYIFETWNAPETSEVCFQTDPLFPVVKYILIVSIGAFKIHNALLWSLDSILGCQHANFMILEATVSKEKS